MVTRICASANTKPFICGAEQRAIPIWPGWLVRPLGPGNNREIANLRILREGSTHRQDRREGLAAAAKEPSSSVTCYFCSRSKTTPHGLSRLSSSSWQVIHERTIQRWNYECGIFGLGAVPAHSLRPALRQLWNLLRCAALSLSKVPLLGASACRDRAKAAVIAPDASCWKFRAQIL